MDEENNHQLSSPLLQDEPQWRDRPPSATSVVDAAAEEILDKLSSTRRSTLSRAELESEFLPGFSVRYRPSVIFI